MIAFGRFASISATGIVDGTISLKTRHSRTRRAISCAYWAPKSTTRTVSNGSADMPALVSAGWGPDRRKRQPQRAGRALGNRGIPRRHRPQRLVRRPELGAGVRLA